MGRKKLFINYGDPITVVHIVKAVIADLPRKERIINYSSAREEILTEYKAINNAIYEAIKKLDPELCSVIMYDIINGVGYNKSKASAYTSINAYYRRKRMFIHDVAVALMLL